MNRRPPPAAILLAMCFAGLMGAQQLRFAGEWSKERADLGSCLDFTKLFSCGETLFTGKPFHIAAGSLAPR